MAATYCSTADLVNLTGSNLDSGVLTAVIEQAQREVDAYLSARGASGTANDACKSATLAVSKALLLERGLQAGQYESSVPDFTSNVNVAGAAKELRSSAHGILDDYLATLTTLTTTRRTFAMKVP